MTTRLLRRPTLRTRRPGAILVAVLATVASLLLVPPATHAGEDDGGHVAARAAGVTVSPARPMVGERAVFSGTLRPRGRPVQLQVRRNGRWVVVARGRVGSRATYRVATRVVRSATYRVRSGGFTSRAVGVRVIGQSARTTAAAPFVTGLTRTVTATLKPVRRGREVVLQRRVGGAWRNVSVRRTNASGVASLPIVGSSVGPRVYRVVGRSFRGSRVVASSPQSVRTAPVTELASPGATAGQESFDASVSADGRWVAFTSEARLRPTDTDDFDDVYLFDRRTGALVHALKGADLHVNNPFLSANGRYLAFQTSASNLLDEPGFDYDVFVLDRSTGEIDLVSEAAAGGPGNRDSRVYGISDDGRFVAYTSTADDLVGAFAPPNTDVVHAYLRDREAGVNRPLDRVGLGWSSDNIFGLDLAADGTRVVFASGDPMLDPGGGVDGNAVFAWTINPDGTISSRTNLTPGIPADSPSVSGDGEEVTFATDDALVAEDTNGTRDGYLRTSTGAFLMTSPVSAAPGTPGEISADGRFVVMSTKQELPGDTNGGQADVVVWRRSTGEHRLVTRGGAGASSGGQLSANGSVLVLSSVAALAPGATGDDDVFVVTLR